MENENLAVDNRTEEQKDIYADLYKSLKTTRILCVISSVLTFALFVAFIILFTKIEPVFAFMDSLGPAVDNIASIDVEAANEALNIFNREAVKIDWEKLSLSIQELDVEAINEAVKGIDVETLNKKLGALDVNELNKSLENLNTASAAISALNERFSGITSIFGR